MMKRPRVELIFHPLRPNPFEKIHYLRINNDARCPHQETLFLYLSSVRFDLKAESAPS